MASGGKKGKVKRFGLGQGGYTRKSLHRLCQNSIDDSQRVATDTPQYLAEMLDFEVSKAIALGIEGKKERGKTLDPRDIDVGIARWHQKWLLENMSALLSDIDDLAQRLHQVRTNIKFGGLEHEDD